MIAPALVTVAVLLLAKIPAALPDVEVPEIVAPVLFVTVAEYCAKTPSPSPLTAVAPMLPEFTNVTYDVGALVALITPMAAPVPVDWAVIVPAAVLVTSATKPA